MAAIQKTQSSEVQHLPRNEEKKLKGPKETWNGKKVSYYGGLAAAVIGSIALAAVAYSSYGAQSPLPNSLMEESPHACELAQGLIMEHSSAENQPYGSYLHPTSMVRRLVDCSLNQLEGSAEFQRSECGKVASRYHTVCSHEGMGSSACKQAFEQVANTCFLSNGLFEVEQGHANLFGKKLTLANQGLLLKDSVQ